MTYITCMMCRSHDSVPLSHVILGSPYLYLPGLLGELQCREVILVPQAPVGPDSWSDDTVIPCRLWSGTTAYQGVCLRPAWTPESPIKCFHNFL